MAIAAFTFCLQFLIIFNVVRAHDDDFGGESYAYEPLYKPPDIPQDVYFAESFSSQESFDSRWILSSAKKEYTDENIAKYDGVWKLEEPMEQVLRGDKGLVLKSKAKHHAISSKLNKPFVFNGRIFIIQFEVKLQRGLDCGGAYIKLLMETDGLNLNEFYDRTPYVIMFGPDKCGNDMKVHFIFRHKNPLTGKFEEKNAVQNSKSLEKIFKGKMTHLYTLIVYPNNNFTIMVDMETITNGNLLRDMEPPVNPPKEVTDPDDTKPLDWDDREMIPDSNAKIPDDWDEDAPELIPDPNAQVPEEWLVDEEEWIPDDRALRPRDWDDEIDGQWEPPMIINPVCEKVLGCGEWRPPLIKNSNFKGKWYPPIVRNSKYKGPWAPRKIQNPNYSYDPLPYNMSTIGALGIELWSMSVDIMFDNFVITSNLEDAKRWAEQSWELKNVIEKERDASAKVSTIDAIVEAANEKPWLWVVIILVIVVPSLFFIICCCAPPPTFDKNGSVRSKKLEGTSPNSNAPSWDSKGQGHLRLRNNAASRNGRNHGPERFESSTKRRMVTQY